MQVDVFLQAERVKSLTSSCVAVWYIQFSIRSKLKVPIKAICKGWKRSDHHGE